MIRTLTETLGVAFLAGLAGLALGCKGGGDEGSLPGAKKDTASAPAPSAEAPKSDGSLTGAGASFPYPLYTKWISEFAKVQPAAKINYQSVGSGAGIQQITKRTVDFGATDAPMNDEQMGKAQGILHIPTCLGAVVLTYNLEGVPSGLKITPEAAAGIFLGTVKDWADPLIAKENPGTKLPKKAIVSVHRSDASGTTRIFTDWLSAASADWKKGPGAGMSLQWPSGLGAKGNEGVAGQVSGTPGAVGYVELVYAAQNKLSYASIKNPSGAFVAPTLASITAAGAAGVSKLADDLRGSVVAEAAPDAYPIAAFTYIVLYDKQTDAAKGKMLVDFLHWATHEGQALAEPLSYAPLPAALVTKIDAKLAKVTGPDGKPFQAAKP
jgi:phosphate transport system substrate-binding protein